MQTKSRKYLNVFQKRLAAAREFATRVSKLASLQEIILFGSTARGQDHPDSDIDIALVLDVASRDELKKVRDNVADIKMDLLLDWEVVINCLYFTKVEWKDSIEPIIRTIKQEGVVLWQKGKIL